MAGEHHYSASVVANEVRQTTPNLHSSMPVVGEGQDAVRVLPPHPNQVGDAMHQHPRLAGAGACEYQHVSLLPVIRHDPSLFRIVQALYDVLPGLRRSLPRQFPFSIGQPAAQELLSTQTEIVHCHPQSFGHGPETPLYVFRHNVNLEDLLVIVQLEGCKVGLHKAASFRHQSDGHGRAKHSQSLVQPDHFLLMQPQ